jgi:5'-nucleotidase
VRILVTNDDGVESPGLESLARVLVSSGHDVFVVAPSTDRSGSSAAIGPIWKSGPIPFMVHDWPSLPGMDVRAIDAAPATAVYAACLGGFGPAPDLVASGINPGPNTGHLVLHSGTVGAALTAAGLGVPAVAVSIGWSDEGAYEWDTAARFGAAAIDWAADPTNGPRVLNVNVPNVAPGDVRGVREASLAPYGTFWTATAEAGEGDVVLEFKGNEIRPDPETDLALVRSGYVAVTPLSVLAAAPIAGAAGSIESRIGFARPPSHSEEERT